MRTALIFEELIEQLHLGKVIKNAPMKEYTSFKTGGPGAILVEPGSLEELKLTLRALKEADLPYFILGRGTNVLVKDGGYPGTIVRMGEAFADIKVSGERIHAGAGALLSAVAAGAMAQELTGLEFAAGIPGSVGGAVFMNAGAYDGDMSRVVEEVRILSRDGSREYTLTGEEMEYGYRQSILTKQQDIVLSAVLKLEKGEKEKIHDKMKDLAARRSAKQPLQYPSAGSFFKRPPGHFAGGLIEEAGLKGLSLGGARISPLHAGFLINEKNATATEIIDLMEVVRHTVYEHAGVMLEPEVRIIGEDSGERKDIHEI